MSELLSAGFVITGVDGRSDAIANHASVQPLRVPNARDTREAWLAKPFPAKDFMTTPTPPSSDPTTTHFYEKCICGHARDVHAGYGPACCFTVGYGTTCPCEKFVADFQGATAENNAAIDAAMLEGARPLGVKRDYDGGTPDLAPQIPNLGVTRSTLGVEAPDPTRCDTCGHTKHLHDENRCLGAYCWSGPHSGGAAGCTCQAFVPSPSSSPALLAPCKEIRGSSHYFINLFMQMARRYPEVRITAEPDGGVAIRFEGSWNDRMRVIDGDTLTPPKPPQPAKRSWITRFLQRISPHA